MWAIFGRGTAFEAVLEVYKKTSTDRSSPCRRIGVGQETHGPVRSYIPYRAILRGLSESGCLFLEAAAALQRNLDWLIPLHQLAKVYIADVGIPIGAPVKTHGFRAEDCGV